MKNKTRKLTAVILSLMMAVAMLAACGGGGGGSSDAPNLDNDGKNAEPNNGIQGIVFAVPDGWEVSSVYEKENMEFSNADTPYTLNVMVTTEETLKTFEDESMSELSIDEYYKKYYIPDEKWIKKNNLEVSNVKVCDEDAIYTKRNGKNGPVSLNTSWVMDDAVYEVYLYNDENFDDKGKMKDDAVAPADEVIEAYEYFVASVKPGDGDALMNSDIKIDSLGSLTFDTPEGFAGANADDKYASFNEKEGEAFIYMNVSTEEDLENFTDGDGNHPKSLREEFNNRIYEGIETTKIAGHDAIIDKYVEEDGNTYSVSAYILTDDMLYDITMEASDDQYDENGLKEGAASLTDAQLAVFDKFLKSFKDK